MSTENEIIGTGWAFPPHFDPEQNTTAMTSGVEDINQSLYILFTTELGERVMQPNYGSAMKSMIFESINEHFKSYMRMVLVRSIALYEARIRPLNIDFIADETLEGRYLMQLDYIIVSTRQRNNFLFPFYLNA
ncbi:GPW/gp25 family protein [Paraflavitalea sp. CAU 1676]|uniref:GPW/gp25 family protein n=1 Tax=Paraflavitalea sp. CAU 1676 TaxID=3032598 RepID=UPI0023DA0896|nr:GPW/gp25 family protein [Paraflavitalea sp. CAU 1676]MDF2188599.1 GPW/gp25 family protein [Paraflavitalea sp. CAU 1676]